MADAKRSTFSNAPFMGLPPRFRVSDLDSSYTSSVVMLDAVSASVLSSAFNPHANSVRLGITFSDAATSCDLSVTNDDGTGTFLEVAKFTGLNSLKQGELYVGQFDQNITLQARAIKVEVKNYSGSGTITVKCARLN